MSGLAVVVPQHPVPQYQVDYLEAVTAWVGADDERRQALFHPVSGSFWAMLPSSEAPPVVRKLRHADVEGDESPFRRGGAATGLVRHGRFGPKTLRWLLSTRFAPALLTNTYLDEATWCALYRAMGPWIGRIILLERVVVLSEEMQRCVVEVEKQHQVVRALVPLLPQDALDVVADRAGVTSSPTSTMSAGRPPFGVTLWEPRSMDGLGGTEEFRWPDLDTGRAVSSFADPMGPHRHAAVVTGWLTSVLGDDPARFERLLGLADSFSGSVAELVAWVLDTDAA